MGASQRSKAEEAHRAAKTAVSGPAKATDEALWSPRCLEAHEKEHRL
uniref:Uncharacterized protein n=1 Tax=Peronospora matthiolae TaxID=2874970 RepID=A0AAV1V5H5_9STRA